MAKEKDKSKPKVVKMTDAEEKKKALESVFSVIEKEYGTGSIMKLGDANSVDVAVCLLYTSTDFGIARAVAGETTVVGGSALGSVHYICLLYTS